MPDARGLPGQARLDAGEERRTEPIAELGRYSLTNAMTDHPDKVLIVDFGSQVHPAHRAAGARGRRLFGDRALRQGRGRARAGPAQGHHPLRRTGIACMRPARRKLSPAVVNSGVPVLGICYGEQAMVAALGGQVEGGHTREFGRAELEIIDDTPLFDGVWRSGDAAAGVDEPWRPRDQAARRLPRRRASRTARRSRPSPTMPASSMACSSIPRWCTRRTAPSSSPISCIGSPAAPAIGRWRSSAPPRSRASERRSGEGRVICGLSGGVDSAVAALLIHEAIGDQLTCIFVDHGLLRENEAREVVDLFRGPLQHPADRGRCRRALPRRASRRHRSRREAQDHRPPVRRGVRRGGRQSSAPSISSPKARSIPT